MGVSIGSVISAISGLTISGLKIKTFLTEKEELDSGRDCPALYPEPANFITGLRIVRDTFGGLKSAEYTLTYTFAYKAIGQGRIGFSEYDAMLTMAAAILDAIISNDTVASQVNDITPENVDYFGLVNDPAGHPFFGCQFKFKISQFLN